MSEKKPYYISTAIAYTSAKPHIGNTYEIVLADAIARYKRQAGFDVYFQPIIRDGYGEKPYAAEALLRYTMPDGERISPAEFIPLLEDWLMQTPFLLECSWNIIFRIISRHRIKFIPT